MSPNEDRSAPLDNVGGCSGCPDATGAVWSCCR